LITAVGVGVAAVSLYVGLQRVHTNQQREYITTLRKAIFSSRSATTKLFSTVVSIDFIYEMAAEVANAKTMNAAIREIYSYFFVPLISSDDAKDKQEQKEEDKQEQKEDMLATLKTYLQNTYLPNEFPETSFVPVQTPLFKASEALVDRTGGEMERYRFEYPSLSRVFLSVNSTLQGYAGSFRDYARDKGVWTAAILKVHEDAANQTINSVEELEGRIITRIVFEWVKQYISDPDHPEHGTRADYTILVNISQIVRIVTSSYLSKSDKDLLNVAIGEKQEDFKPPEETDSIEQDLDEAYKGLRHILTDLEGQDYHDLVRQIKEAKARKELG